MWTYKSNKITTGRLQSDSRRNQYFTFHVLIKHTSLLHLLKDSTRSWVRNYKFTTVQYASQLVHSGSGYNANYYPSICPPINCKINETKYNRIYGQISRAWKIQIIYGWHTLHLQKIILIMVACFGIKTTTGLLAW